jgi:hypothetical protein
MLSTNIMKWAIEEFKPEGFNLTEDKDYIRAYSFRYALIYKQVNDDVWANAYYPLLLQRVIEGINSNSENILIDQSGTSVQTRIEINGGETTEFNTFPIHLDRYDRAKELAIEYIYKELHK